MASLTRPCSGVGRHTSSSRVPISRDDAFFALLSRGWSESYLRRPVATEPPKVVLGRPIPFLRLLLAMIRKEAIARPQVMRWSQDGRVFFVDDEGLFVRNILTQNGFEISKLKSFQRNLDFHGFTRLSKGTYASGYVHSKIGRDINEEELESIICEFGKKECAEDKYYKRKRDDDEAYRIEFAYSRSVGRTPSSLRAPSKVAPILSSAQALTYQRDSTKCTHAKTVMAPVLAPELSTDDFNAKCIISSRASKKAGK